MLKSCRRAMNRLAALTAVLGSLCISGLAFGQAPDASAPAAAPTAAPAAAPAAAPPAEAPAAPAAEAPAPPAAAAAPAAPVQQGYVGTSKCLICHRPQTNTYSETKHAKAFANMPEKYHNDPQCLKCHATGFGQPEGFVENTEKDLRMVGCEACHGPGAKHLDAANRFVMANPGEEATIEKELKSTILKTPQDSACIACHQMQAHHGHPAFEGAKLQGTVSAANAPCAPGNMVTEVATSFPANPISHYTAKTCGGCHYEQYKHWRVEKHADLSKSLPAKYADDQSCKECHAVASGVPATANLPAELHNQWAGLVCEKCHGPALGHINFNKQFLASTTYSPKIEAAARESIRKGKPTATCLQCHTRIGHKEHVPYEKGT